jgi:hypothetical protein
MQVTAGVLTVLKVIMINEYMSHQTGSLISSFSIEAEPVIEKALESAPEDAIFVYVGVGDRSL